MTRRQSKFSADDIVGIEEELSEEGESRGPRASVQRQDCMDTDGLFEADSEKLIGDMGISGIAVLSKWRDRTLVELFYIATYAFVIQAIILAYIFAAIVPATEAKSVSWAIIGMAIYLHICNCIADIPFSIMIVAYWKQLRGPAIIPGVDEVDKWSTLEMIITLPFFLTDAFVVPLTTMTLGGLYLCTSKTAPEVIFNSCAVAFVKDVDNIILSLHQNLKNLAAVDMVVEVQVPYMKRMAYACTWSLSYVPIVPIGAAVCFCVAGINMGL